MSHTQGGNGVDPHQQGWEGVGPGPLKGGKRQGSHVTPPKGETESSPTNRAWCLKGVGPGPIKGGRRQESHVTPPKGEKESTPTNRDGRGWGQAPSKEGGGRRVMSPHQRGRRSHPPPTGMGGGGARPHQRGVRPNLILVMHIFSASLQEIFCCFVTKQYDEDFKVCTYMAPETKNQCDCRQVQSVSTNQRNKDDI